jgi:hypothetical protein
VGPDAKRTAGFGGHLNLQYGEVVPRSVLRDVLGAVMGGPDALGPPHVLYDLGSGTGKIPFLGALWSGVGASVGVEYAALRHAMGTAALATLGRITGADLLAQAAAARFSLTPSHADAAAAALRDVAGSGRVVLVHGDFLATPRLVDATHVFVNNTVFEAPLMLALAGRLAGLPRLRRLCVIKALCGRHGGRCVRGGAPCCSFAHPPLRTDCEPTWDADVPLWGYLTPAAVADGDAFAPPGDWVAARAAAAKGASSGSSSAAAAAAAAASPVASRKRKAAAAAAADYSSPPRPAEAAASQAPPSAAAASTPPHPRSGDRGVAAAAASGAGDDDGDEDASVMAAPVPKLRRLMDAGSSSSSSSSSAAGVVSSSAQLAARLGRSR